MSPPSLWRILRTPPDSGPWNMALDVALARCVGPEEGVLRIYSWQEPTLSLGRNQPARERYESLAATDLAGRVVRRPTGGREVLHDRELTYSVVLPARAFGGPRSTYRIINSALLEAVRSFGVPARLARSTSPAPRPGDGACFDVPAVNEIQVGGRKLVGSAQARIDGALLQHGSLVLAPPSVARGAFGSLGTCLEDLVSDSVHFDEMADAIEVAMVQALPGRWRRGHLRPVERRVAASFLPHYESPSWTWRR